MDRGNVASANVAMARKAFVADQRYHVGISQFLRSVEARRLHRWLRDSDLWGLSFSDGDRIFGLAPSQYCECSSADRASLYAAAYAAAETGFAFVREQLWDVPTDEDAISRCPTPLRFILQLLRSERFSRYLCDITGSEYLRLVRLCLERHTRGHFTAFTKGAPADAQFGFSLDLTSFWETQWGGLLEVSGFFGEVERGYVPRFNSLIVYSLQRSRAVSFVSALAERDRYTLVGQMATS
jgi:hypothetical protein